MAKPIVVKIADLEKSFYVREQTSDKHLDYLLSLHEGGIRFPPITINKNNEVVDGRHRVELAKILDQLTIEAIVIDDGKTEVESAALALKSNVGGSLPPTKQDIVHAFRYFIGKGFNNAEIKEQFSKSIPASMVRVLLSRAHTEIIKAKAFRAIQLIKSEGLSLEQAAKAVGLKTIQAIQDAMKISTSHSLPKFNNIIICKFTTLNRGNGQLITQLFNAYKDGEISQEDVFKKLELLGKAIANTQRLFNDWQSRFIKMT